MTMSEVLEMQRIVITSNLSDEKVGRLNELQNMAYKDKYDEGYAEGHADGYSDGYEEGCADGLKKALDDVLAACARLGVERFGNVDEFLKFIKFIEEAKA